MTQQHSCPSCDATRLTVLLASYRGTVDYRPNTNYQAEDRITCPACGWIGRLSLLDTQDRPKGLKTCFEWNLQDYSSSHDDNFYRVMDLAESQEANYVEFMALVHPDDKEAIVATLEDQFVRGGFKATRFRLARPPHKMLYVASTVELDATKKPFRMSGYIQEWN